MTLHVKRICLTWYFIKCPKDVWSGLFKSFSCLPVRCKNNWATFLHYTGQRIPQETASNWVHASGGFILLTKVPELFTSNTKLIN